MRLKRLEVDWGTDSLTIGVFERNPLVDPADRI